jgi:hypothetical protein
MVTESTRGEDSGELRLALIAYAAAGHQPSILPSLHIHHVNWMQQQAGGSDRGVSCRGEIVPARVYRDDVHRQCAAL